MKSGYTQLQNQASESSNGQDRCFFSRVGGYRLYARRKSDDITPSHMNDAENTIDELGMGMNTWSKQLLVEGF